MRRKLIALAAVVLATAAGCTTPDPVEDHTGRITYAIETFRLDGAVETSVLVPVHAVANIKATTTRIPYIRDGRSGAWLVLPWEAVEDMATPLRYQFTYDTRQTSLLYFVLKVSATVTADPGTHLRCAIYDTSEHLIGISSERVISGTGTDTVSCTSQ